VTNKHVVSNAINGPFTFTRALEKKPILEQGFKLDVKGQFENMWFGHPNSYIDVAVTPLVSLLDAIKKYDVEVFFRGISREFVPSIEILKELDAIEEVVFIGYPNWIWDTHNLLPIARKGITASPISLDFKGQPQFLIDASVFPGSSGSPVFLYNAGIYHDKKGVTTVGTRIYFLGIVAQVFYRVDLNKIGIISESTIGIPVAESKQMIDLGIVFKSSTIIETIEKFLQERKEIWIGISCEHLSLQSLWVSAHFLLSLTCFLKRVNYRVGGQI
jgi:hypothetical protein